MEHQSMSQIVDKMKSGAKLQSSEGKYYKTWLVFPDGSTEKISKKIANQIAIKYADELIFGEHEGIRFRKIKYAMPEGINSKEDHEEYLRVISSNQLNPQKTIELMQVLEMIEASLQKGNSIRPDSFIIRNAIRLSIGMDVLNNEVDKSGLYCDFPCCKNVGTNKVEKTAVYYCDEHF
jgi:hypothetical protein